MLKDRVYTRAKACFHKMNGGVFLCGIEGDDHEWPEISGD